MALNNMQNRLLPHPETKSPERLSPRQGFAVMCNAGVGNRKNTPSVIDGSVVIHYGGPQPPESARSRRSLIPRSQDTV